MRVKKHLAQAQALWRHLNQLIFIDIGHHLLKRHLLGGNEFDRLIATGRPHIRQLLALQNIDLKIVVAVVFTNNHSLIDRCLWIDEHQSAILQIEERIGNGNTGVRGDQRTIATPLNITPIGRIGVKNAVQHTRATCLGEKSALIPDQAARRCEEHDPGLACPCGTHVEHLTLATIHAVHDSARKLIINVDCDLFHRFDPVACLIGLKQHTRTRHCHLKSLAPHLLDQNTKLQFATTTNLKGIL